MDKFKDVRLQGLTAAIHKKNSYFLIIFIFALLLSICGTSSAFDEGKVQLLSEQNIRLMDVSLFNELYSFRTNTNRCGVDPNSLSTTFKCRLAFFKLLASEGHEVADILSKLYKPDLGEIQGDLREFSRLHLLAKRGDKSALCFAEAILVQIPTKYIVNWPYTLQTEAEFTKKGEIEHLPVCTYMTGLHFLNGTNGYPKNESLAFKYIHQAAIDGIYAAQSYLAKYFQERGVNDSNNPLKNLRVEDMTVEEMERINNSSYIPSYRVNNMKSVRTALCWGRLADQFKIDSGTAVADILRMAAKDKNYITVHPEYIQLANLWDIRVTSFQDKPITAEDCITIEGSN